jgi:DNA-binding GntR family transcriptional regulator
MVLTRSTLKNQIKEVLRERILNGYYRPGERLLVLKLARELGTSQAPVREALGELQSARLIESKPHAGMRVRMLGEKDVREIFAVRAALEECATRLATPKLASDTSSLRASIAKMAQAAEKNDLEDLINQSIAFHRQILVAADNDLLLETWDSLRIEAHTLTGILKGHIDWTRVAGSHDPIVAAIEQNDPEAAGIAAREHQEFYAAAFELQLAQQA